MCYIFFDSFFICSQIMIWFVIPNAGEFRYAAHQNHTLSLIVLIQYVPRILVMLPLNRRIIKATGVAAKTAWSGAAYNLVLYLLVSHVSNPCVFLHMTDLKEESPFHNIGFPFRFLVPFGTFYRYRDSTSAGEENALRRWTQRIRRLAISCF